MPDIIKRKPKIINARTHAIIDYIHAGTNLAAGVILRNKNRRASNAAFALGAGILANALMTDYPLGVFRLYSFKTHAILDYGVAIASGMMPEVARIKETPAAKFFRVEGSGETAIAAMTNYEDTTGAKRRVTGENGRFRKVKQVAERVAQHATS